MAGDDDGSWKTSKAGGEDAVHDEDTKFYVLYLETIRLSQPEAEDLRACVHWYIGESDYSSVPFVIPAQCTEYELKNCAFVVLPDSALANDLDSNSLTISITTWAGEHLGVFFGHCKDVGTSETFDRHDLDLLHEDGIFAKVEMHAACQTRWTEAKVDQKEAAFVDPGADEQAKHIWDFIADGTDSWRGKATANKDDKTSPDSKASDTVSPDGKEAAVEKDDGKGVEGLTSEGTSSPESQKSSMEAGKDVTRKATETTRKSTARKRSTRVSPKKSKAGATQEEAAGLDEKQKEDGGKNENELNDQNQASNDVDAATSGKKLEGDGGDEAGIQKEAEDKSTKKASRASVSPTTRKSTRTPSRSRKSTAPSKSRKSTSEKKVTSEAKITRAIDRASLEDGDIPEVPDLEETEEGVEEPEPPAPLSVTRTPTRKSNVLRTSSSRPSSSSPGKKRKSSSTATDRKSTSPGGIADGQEGSRKSTATREMSARKSSPNKVSAVTSSSQGRTSATTTSTPPRGKSSLSVRPSSRGRGLTKLLRASARNQDDPQQGSARGVVGDFLLENAVDKLHQFTEKIFGTEGVRSALVHPQSGKRMQVLLKILMYPTGSSSITGASSSTAGASSSSGGATAGPRAPVSTTSGPSTSSETTETEAFLEVTKYIADPSAFYSDSLSKGKRIKSVRLAALRGMYLGSELMPPQVRSVIIGSDQSSEEEHFLHDLCVTMQISEDEFLTFEFAQPGDHVEAAHEAAEAEDDITTAEGMLRAECLPEFVELFRSYTTFGNSKARKITRGARKSTREGGTTTAEDFNLLSRQSFPDVRRLCGEVIEQVRRGNKFQLAGLRNAATGALSVAADAKDGADAVMHGNAEDEEQVPVPVPTKSSKAAASTSTVSRVSRKSTSTRSPSRSTRKSTRRKSASGGKSSDGDVVSSPGATSSRDDNVDVHLEEDVVSSPGEIVRRRYLAKLKESLSTVSNQRLPEAARQFFSLKIRRFFADHRSETQEGFVMPTEMRARGTLSGLTSEQVTAKVLTTAAVDDWCSEFWLATEKEFDEEQLGLSEHLGREIGLPFSLPDHAKLFLRYYLGVSASANAEGGDDNAVSPKTSKAKPEAKKTKILGDRSSLRIIAHSGTAAPGASSPETTTGNSKTKGERSPSPGGLRMSAVQGKKVRGRARTTTSLRTLRMQERAVSSDDDREAGVDDKPSSILKESRSPLPERKSSSRSGRSRTPSKEKAALTSPRSQPYPDWVQLDVTPRKVEKNTAEHWMEEEMRHVSSIRKQRRAEQNGGTGTSSPTPRENQKRDKQQGLESSPGGVALATPRAENSRATDAEKGDERYTVSPSGEELKWKKRGAKKEISQYQVLRNGISLLAEPVVGDDVIFSGTRLGQGAIVVTDLVLPLDGLKYLRLIDGSGWLVDDSAINAGAPSLRRMAGGAVIKPMGSVQQEELPTSLDVQGGASGGSSSSRGGRRSKGGSLVETRVSQIAQNLSQPPRTAAAGGALLASSTLVRGGGGIQQGEPPYAWPPVDPPYDHPVALSPSSTKNTPRVQPEHLLRPDVNGRGIAAGLNYTTMLDGREGHVSSPHTVAAGAPNMVGALPARKEFSPRSPGDYNDEDDIPKLRTPRLGSGGAPYQSFEQKTRGPAQQQPTREIDSKASSSFSTRAKYLISPGLNGVPMAMSGMLPVPLSAAERDMPISADALMRSYEPDFQFQGT
ncbi:unnamed protein product [Amoebophrya sp. A25]|nr:unnamed protein product [Amoebophrya sp. A25]|eukprot:GSA25T00006379001.1